MSYLCLIFLKDAIPLAAFLSLGKAHESETAEQSLLSWPYPVLGACWGPHSGGSPVLGACVACHARVSRQPLSPTADDTARQPDPLQRGPQSVRMGRGRTASKGMDVHHRAQLPPAPRLNGRELFRRGSEVSADWTAPFSVCGGRPRDQHLFGRM